MVLGAVETDAAICRIEHYSGAGDDNVACGGEGDAAGSSIATDSSNGQDLVRRESVEDVVNDIIDAVDVVPRSVYC